MMIHKIPFNFGKLVYDHILQLALRPQSKFYLAYPSLVHRLIQSQRPVEIKAADLPKVAKKSSRRSATPAFKVGTSGDRKAMRLAIQILQDALAAGGDVSDDGRDH